MFSPKDILKHHATLWHCDISQVSTYMIGIFTTCVRITLNYWGFELYRIYEIPVFAFYICGGYWLSVEYCMCYRYRAYLLTWREITHKLYLWNIFGIKSTVKVGDSSICCFTKSCMGGSKLLSCLYSKYDALASLTLQKKSNVSDLF